MDDFCYTYSLYGRSKMLYLTFNPTYIGPLHFESTGVDWLSTVTRVVWNGPKLPILVKRPWYQKQAQNILFSKLSENNVIGPTKLKIWLVKDALAIFVYSATV